eukprot:5580599-Ditylum_brightwellii.AAC.1
MANDVRRSPKPPRRCRESRQPEQKRDDTGDVRRSPKPPRRDRSSRERHQQLKSSPGRPSNRHEQKRGDKGDVRKSPKPKLVGESRESPQRDGSGQNPAENNQGLEDDNPQKENEAP